MNRWQLSQAARALHAGQIIAYPTEAVWGLGCDPYNLDALGTLLTIKQRPAHKGMILVAANLEQLEPFIEALSPELRDRIVKPRRHAVTWLLPAQTWVPSLLRGNHNRIAIRISNHGTVRALCQAIDSALVSTSANIAGRPPARSALSVRRLFHGKINRIIPGKTGDARRPSEIRDAITGKIIRAA